MVKIPAPEDEGIASKTAASQSSDLRQWKSFAAGAISAVVLLIFVSYMLSLGPFRPPTLVEAIQQQQQKLGDAFKREEGKISWKVVEPQAELRSDRVYFRIRNTGEESQHKVIGELRCIAEGRTFPYYSEIFAEDVSGGIESGEEKVLEIFISHGLPREIAVQAKQHPKAHWDLKLQNAPPVKLQVNRKTQTVAKKNLDSILNFKLQPKVNRFPLGDPRNLAPQKRSRRDTLEPTTLEKASKRKSVTIDDIRKMPGFIPAPNLDNEKGEKKTEEMLNRSPFESAK